MSDEKQDIRHHADGELSLHFMNDEYLYNILVYGDWDTVKETVSMMFTYSEAQLDDLRETFLENEDDV